MYLGKKGELVSLIAIGVLLLVGGLIFFKSGGITGAAIGIQPISNNSKLQDNFSTNITINETSTKISNNDNYVTNNKNNVPSNVGIQDITTQATTHLISTCQALNVSGDTYELTADVTTPTSGPLAGICFRFLNYSITLDCHGYNITYTHPNGAGLAVMANRSGSAPPTIGNLTIKNCEFQEGTQKDPDSYSIFIHNTKNVTILNNTLYVHQTRSNGIMLSNVESATTTNNTITLLGLLASYEEGAIVVSGTTTSTFINNNITAFYLNNIGIIINGTSSKNTFYNTKIDTDAAGFGNHVKSIDDSSGHFHYLIYNNTFSLINIHKINLTVIDDLIPGVQIFQSQNLTGIQDNQYLQQLNSTALVGIKNLDYISAPRIFRISGGNRYDCNSGTTPSCTSIYYSGSIVNFTASSFSNYTTLAENTSPTVTFDNPPDSANLSFGLQAFNATVMDSSNISAVIFMFDTNTTPFNISAYNSTGFGYKWHNNVNISTIVEGTQTVTIFANDSLNNVNQTESITINVDFHAPNVTVITPKNGRNYSKSSFNQTFNLSLRDALTGVKNATLSFDNATGNAFNVTTVNSSGYWSASYNVSSLVEGSQTITIYSYDYAGNLNNTNTITFTTDYTAPNVTIISPKNNPDYNITTGNITFNLSLRDILTGVKNTTLSFDNATSNAFNVTTVNSSGYWSASYNVSKLAKGSHTVTIYSYDYSGNLNNTNMITFTVSSIPPTQGTPILNTTNLATNDTNTNLTAYNISTSDLDNDVVKNIYNWQVDGNSITLLNMPFEGINGTSVNNTLDYSGHTTSILEVGNSILWNSSGGYDGRGAYEFGGSSDYINGSGLPATSSNEEITISAWVNPDSISLTRQIFIKGDKNDCFSYGMAIVDGQLRSNNNDFYNSLGSTTVSTNTWSFLAVTFNSSGSYGYWNGTYVGSSTTVKVSSCSSKNYTIGFKEGTSFYFDGTIDDLQVWNRSLSAQQILALYNNRSDLIVSQETNSGEYWNISITPNDNSNDGIGKLSNTVRILDHTPPSVTILNPPDGINLSSGLQAFNSSVIDTESSIYDVLFMFTSNTTPFNVTATNVSGNWNANVNISTIVEGTHTMTVFANDTFGNVNNTESINIYVDRTAPNVTIITPKNGRNYSKSSFNQTFNVSMRDTLTGVKNVTFSFDNVTGSPANPAFNVTAVNGSGYWAASYNVSNLAEGLNTVTIYSYDYSGNLNNTNTITFTTDYTAPNVTIIFPQEGQNFTEISYNQTFNISLRDTLTGVKNATLSFDNSSGKDFNITLVNSSGYWKASYNVSTLAQGTNSFTVYTYDYAGNLNNTVTTNFNMNYPSPSFRNASNTSLNFRQNQNFTANITINDSNNLDYYIYSTNSNGSWTNFTFDISGNEYNASVSRKITVAAGTQVCWYYWANNTLGNYALSSTYCFIVQTTPSGGGGGNPSSSSPQPSTSTTTTTTTTPTPTPVPTEQPETVGELSISVSNPVSTDGTDESELTIYNSGKETVELDGKLKDDYVLENKDNIEKKLSSQGLSGVDLKNELEALRLIDKLQVLPAHTGKVVSLFSSPGIIKATGNHIKAEFLKTRLVNENELRGIIIPPGQTYNGKVVLKKGLTLSPKDIQVVFTTKDKEVFTKDFAPENQNVGTDLDVVDTNNKIIDLYIKIPPVEGGGAATYSVELDFNELNAEKQIKQKIPVMVESPFELFSTKNSIDTKLLGPYKVDLEKGALIAGQYEILRPGKYNVVSKTYKGGDELVAENKFELDLG